MQSSKYRLLCKKNCVSSFYATSLWKLDSIFSGSSRRRRDFFFQFKAFTTTTTDGTFFSNEIMCRPIILVKKVKIVEAHRFVTPGKIGWTWKMSLEGVVFIRHPDFSTTPFTNSLFLYSAPYFKYRSDCCYRILIWKNRRPASVRNWCTTSEVLSSNVCPKWWDVVADFCMNCFATSMTTPNHRGLK